MSLKTRKREAVSNMDVENFPSDFWRGIASRDFISNGVVLANAFQFDDAIREDGYKELSINWNDCDDSLKIALEQRKPNGKLQFSVGVAKLDLGMVELFLSTFIKQGVFSYERRKVEGNPYHGNLLIHGELDKQSRSLVSSGLALVAGTNITYQQEE